MEIKLNTNIAAVYSNKEANTETRNCLRLYGQTVWRQKSIFKVTKHIIRHEPRLHPVEYITITLSVVRDIHATWKKLLSTVHGNLKQTRKTPRFSIYIK